MLSIFKLLKETGERVVAESVNSADEQARVDGTILVHLARWLERSPAKAAIDPRRIRYGVARPRDDRLSRRRPAAESRR